MQATSTAAIELRGINKRFGRVQANSDISLRIERGSIHGIVGENGAGKSTLMSILFGYYQADSGDILINGKDLSVKSPSDALSAGVGMVHQHFMLVDTFSIVENAVLGAEGGMTVTPALRRARRELTQLASDYSLEVPLDTKVSELTVGQRQRGEILKALYRGADILILDEPTSVLTPHEADHLFRILDQLREQGKTVVLITHKLREIIDITDQVTVMRAGRAIDTIATRDTNTDHLAELMIGRRVRQDTQQQPREPGKTVLEVNNLNVVDNAGVVRVNDVSLRVREGEIVGIAGVTGNGQSELLEAITGMHPISSGQIQVNDNDLTDASFSALQLHDLGVGHVPEDRQGMGLVIPFQARENNLLGYHNQPQYRSGALLNHNAITRDTQEKMTKYDVRPLQPDLTTGLFSGGNQQKLVIAREMEQQPQLLIVGQPTRGVDIGAIEFIHQRLIAMRDNGQAILLVSVELDEILHLADRILVMFEGRIVGERDRSANENELGLLMTGVERSASANNE